MMSLFNALAAGLMALALLRPVCIWGLSGLRQGHIQKQLHLPPLSYGSRVCLVWLVLLFLPWVGIRFGFTLFGLAMGALVLIALVLGWIDAQTGYLPDRLTLPLLFLGLLLNWADTVVTWDMALWGALLGWSLLYALNVVFFMWRGQQGMGGGDGKLLAALGAWLGVQALPAILLLSSVLSMLYVMLLLACGYWYPQRRLHFGPYLVTATLWWVFFQLPAVG